MDEFQQWLVDEIASLETKVKQAIEFEERDWLQGALYQSRLALLRYLRMKGQEERNALPRNWRASDLVGLGQADSG